jgi:hypothetical protein
LTVVERALHDVQDATVVFGHTDIDRGSGPVSRLVGWLFGFPPAGRRLPTVITVLATGGKPMPRVKRGPDPDQLRCFIW